MAQETEDGKNDAGGPGYGHTFTSMKQELTSHSGARGLTSGPQGSSVTETTHRSDVTPTSGSSEYLCPACDVTFLGETPWRNHMESYHWWRTRSRIQCALCPDVKTNLKEIAEHAQVHRNIMHECQQCPSVFPPERGYALRHRLLEHSAERTRPQPTPFCDQCGQELLSTSDLAFHQLMLHDVTIPVRDTNRTARHACNYCEEVFSRSKPLFKHILNVHAKDSELYHDEVFLMLEEEEEEEDMVEVPIEETIHSDNFKKPKKKNTLPVDVPGPPYICTSCNKVCKSAATYVAHRNKHCLGSGGEKRKKQYLCNLCGTVLTTNSGFRQHMANHTDKNKYACDICHKTFSVLSQVNFHRKQHARPFACQSCDKRFKTLSHLNDHKITHSEEQNFPCDLCDARFKWRPTLMRHKYSVHSVGDKPHNSSMRRMLCALCNMCISSGTRTKHFRRRHKDLPYDRKYFTLLPGPLPAESAQSQQQQATLSNTAGDEDDGGCDGGSGVAASLPPAYINPQPVVSQGISTLNQNVPAQQHEHQLTNSIMTQQFIPTLNTISGPSTATVPTASTYKFPVLTHPHQQHVGEEGKFVGVTHQAAESVTFDVVSMPPLDGQEGHYQVVRDSIGMPLIIPPQWQTTDTQGETLATQLN